MNKERVGRIVHSTADYYDPKGEPMPKELEAILEDLLQTQLTVTPVMTNISSESQKDGSWLTTYIQELIDLQLLLSPSPTKEPKEAKSKQRQSSKKKGQSQNGNSFFKNNGKTKEKARTKQQLKPRLPIQKRADKKSQQRLSREFRNLFS